MSSGAASISRSTSHRHQSGNPRTASSASTPHRSQSQSYRAPPASPQASPGNLANVARRDFEQSNVAQLPPPYTRSASRDRAAGSGVPARSESTRSNHHRGASRSEHARYASIDAAAAAQQPPTNGMVVDNTNRAVQPTAGRRRTTISTTTGTWILGKTIGAGSMGKVKLAKNAETNEQVGAIRCDA
jgi:serine/threonine protein kinase KIN1/2